MHTTAEEHIIVETRLAEAAKLLEAEMQRIMDLRKADRTGYEQLKKAMEYSLFAGGKRVRPYLCMEFCKLAGGSVDQALPYAAALEFMHTASLIHDDLPAMDNDDMRRGKPTNHVVYGEYTAILAGDALIIESFNAIAKNALCSAEQNMRATALLARCAGFDGMCGGQQMDLLCEGQEVSVWTVEKTHLLKTAAMMCASAQLGVIAGGGNEELFENAGKFAKEIGLTFQIIDDILDVTADKETLGKTAGKDISSRKSTYVTRAGLDDARMTAEALTGCALSRAELMEGKCDGNLAALCRYLLCRKY